MLIRHTTRIRRSRVQALHSYIYSGTKKISKAYMTYIATAVRRRLMMALHRRLTLNVNLLYAFNNQLMGKLNYRGQGIVD